MIASVEINSQNPLRGAVNYSIWRQIIYAPVVELVDTADLRSAALTGV